MTKCGIRLLKTKLAYLIRTLRLTETGWISYTEVRPVLYFNIYEEIFLSLFFFWICTGKIYRKSHCCNHREYFLLLRIIAVKKISDINWYSTNGVIVMNAYSSLLQLEIWLFSRHTLIIWNIFELFLYNPVIFTEIILLLHCLNKKTTLMVNRFFTYYYFYFYFRQWEQDSLM